MNIYRARAKNNAAEITTLADLMFFLNTKQEEEED